jgi:histidinol dehydrogenase
MRRIDISQPAGRKAWKELVGRLSADPLRVRTDALTRRAFGRPVSPRQAVERILTRVQGEGDRALVEFTRRLDGVRTTAAGLRVSGAERRAAVRRVPASLRRAVQVSAEHIRDYHRTQMPRAELSRRRVGVHLRERCLPLARVGIYVPGGRAPLISTVLMNALPAAIAGVSEIAMATPPGPGGRIPDALLFAAETAGIREIYRLGGAAAIAAFALGTRTIPRVDKIVGPGNVFVSEAKRQVTGLVGIDSLAGPSEIIVIADAGADPVFLAWDLLGQGEHGSGAVAILLTPVFEILERTLAALRAILRQRPEFQPAAAAIALIKVRDLAQAAHLAEEYRPEHLSLQTARPQTLAASIRHAGAIFLGRETPQAMGDYIAGPNHVLPTGGTARWSSPLSVRDFLRYTSVIAYTPAGVRAEGPAAVEIAEAEGLAAHAESIRIRSVSPVAKRGAGEQQNR